ncbi:MAG: hypothetical protein R3188_01670 [Acidiferrobacterales bacterium]|nr:hypothetical protein [Acidiferrobacterales bacterium]
MNIRNIIASLLAIVTMSTCSTASAGMYMLGSAGITAHEYVDVRSAGAYKLGVGFMMPTNFGFEASYMNLGSALVSGGGTLEMSGTNLSGVFELPLRPLVMSFKLGIYNIDTTHVDPGFPFSGSAGSSGLSWGFLLGYEINRNTMLFMDTEGFDSIVVPTGSGDSWESPALITFGVRMEF